MPAPGLVATPGPGGAAPTPRPPQRLHAPDADSTGDAEIDRALAALTAVDPEDLDGHLASGQELHDLLRSRLDGAPGA